LILNFIAMTNHCLIGKKSLSKHDICTKFIIRAIQKVVAQEEMQFSKKFILGKFHVWGKSSFLINYPIHIRNHSL